MQVKSFLPSALFALFGFVEQVQVAIWANLIKAPILLDFDWMRLVAIPALEGFLFGCHLFSHNFKQYSRFLDKVKLYFGLFPQ